jgi:hypothetical protein
MGLLSKVLYPHAYEVLYTSEVAKRRNVVLNYQDNNEDKAELSSQ